MTECEYCGRKDGTHDDECPVATGAVEKIKDAAGNPAPPAAPAPTETPAAGGDDDELEAAPVIGRLDRIIEGDQRIAYIVVSDDGALVRAVLTNADLAPNDDVTANDIEGALEPVVGETATTVDGQPAIVKHTPARKAPIIPQPTLLDAMATVAKIAARLESLKAVAAERKAEHDAAAGDVKEAESQLRHANAVALDSYRREQGEETSHGPQLVLGES